jgi:hypothetical protein
VEEVEEVKASSKGGSTKNIAAAAKKTKQKRGSIKQSARASMKKTALKGTVKEQNSELAENSERGKLTRMADQLLAAQKLTCKKHGGKEATVTVELFGTLISRAPPRHRTTAPPHHRTTAPPHHRTTAPPHHSTTAPPHHRTTAPPHHRTTAPPQSNTRTPRDRVDEPPPRGPAAARRTPHSERTRARLLWLWQGWRSSSTRMRSCARRFASRAATRVITGT